MNYIFVLMLIVSFILRFFGKLPISWTKMAIWRFCEWSWQFQFLGGGTVTFLCFEAFHLLDTKQPILDFLMVNITIFTIYKQGENPLDMKEGKPCYR